MKHYCYVYYDENWQATYVGKGAGQRFYAPRGFPIPPRERIQRFFFDEEWQAWECEIELIAFWRRQCDGGCLLNQATGGPGCPGVVPSQETRDKRSAKLKGRIITDEWKQKISLALKGKPISQKTREAASRAHKGKPKSEEHRRKISKALKGNTNGKRCGKPVRVKNNQTGEVLSFCSHKEAALGIGCCVDSIHKLHKNIFKQIKGWSLAS